MRRLVLALVLLATPAAAEDWQPRDGAGIRAALTSRTLGYPDGTSQDFKPDGQTLAGGAWGKWRVEGDRYCSAWPPSDLWACYEVATRGLEVRFTAENGAEVVGRYIDLN